MPQHRQHDLIEPRNNVEIKSEYFDILNHLLANDESRYQTLLGRFVNNQGFRDFRNKVLGTVSRLSEHYSSIAIGIFYDKASVQVQGDIGSYRVFQADYDSIKSFYVDIFELMSRMTLYVGMTANLVKRNNADHFLPIQINNKTKQITSPESFRKLAAFDKLKILVEMPKLQALFSSVSRPMRNDIGHFNAQYDFRSGNLVYEDGSQTSYIVFLNQLLESIRALWFLVGVIEKIEIDLQKYNI